MRTPADASLWGVLGDFVDLAKWNNDENGDDDDYDDDDDDGGGDDVDDNIKSKIY
jgi:hypothetical protein